MTDVGDGVDPTLVGTRVAFVTGGIGAYGEYVTVAAAMATAVPAGVSPVDAVAVAAPGATALGLLHRAGLGNQETVLVEAGAGAVGSYLIQHAKEFGAGRVITTAGSPAKRERALELGADTVLDHNDPNWPDLLRGALDGATLDVAFESIGGSSAQRVLDTLTPSSGRMVLYGALSGQSPTIDLTGLQRTGVSIIGCGGLGWFQQVIGGCYPQILARLAEGSTHALIDSVLPLADAAKAHQRIEDRTAIGKIILVP